MLEIDQLIKIILGLVVVAAVVLALFLFGDNISSFFGNLAGGKATGGIEVTDPSKLFLSLK